MSHQIKKLEMDPGKALFSGNLDGMIAICCENERPLQGLAGELDWRFDGSFSKFLRRGSFSGKSGECVYLPVRRAGRLYHIIFVGGGSVKHSGIRPKFSKKMIKDLSQNLKGLNISKLGISKSDFKDIESQDLTFDVDGVSLWLVN